MFEGVTGIFETIHISWLFYIIIVIASLMALTCAGLYMAWNYHLGKPMAPFFWLRIKGWTQRGVALFEVFSLTNSVTLEEARKEIGDGYRLYTPSTIEMPSKKAGWWMRKYNYIFARNLQPANYSVEKIKRIQNLIMPKSTYSINGVATIPLWDLHPQLHTDLLEGVKILINNGITTLHEFTEFVAEKENAEQNMFKNYSYRTFYDLYLGVRQKYNIVVTTDDVANFIGKQFDKNFRESIEAKDFNAMQKGKMENKYIYYGYIIIGIAVIGVVFKIIYTTIYK
jgi:hypothetical protein